MSTDDIDPVEAEVAELKLARIGGLNKPNNGNGRPKGAMNRTSQEIRARVEARLGSKSIPEILVDWAVELYDQGQIESAANIIDKAAKFTYPTLKAIEHSGGLKVEMPLCPEMGEAPAMN